METGESEDNETEHRQLSRKWRGKRSSKQKSPKRKVEESEDNETEAPSTTESGKRQREYWNRKSPRSVRRERR
ncbi:MAG: hypothetical protein ACLTSZ_09005 [Lachnospiraceae bacterium]